MRKKINISIIVFFILSLIPIFLLAGVNQATGDDFGYGVGTHLAWITTHSLWEVLKEAGQTVLRIYSGWQGTWFTIFLFTLQPEVFSPNAYVIVPYIVLAIWIGTTLILAHYILKKIIGFDSYTVFAVISLLLLAGMQFVPSTKSAIFWYNGTMHYMVPYGLALLAIYWAVKFIYDEKWSSLILASIGTILLGGTNYQAALLAPIVIVLLVLVFWKRNKKARLLLLSVFLELPGLIISMKAPGNKNRGGEDFGFSVGQAIGTIGQCFLQGAKEIGHYIEDKPMAFILLVIAAIIIWWGFSENKRNNRYPYPLLFVVLSYCVYCAMYAPQIYAGVEVSGGVYNMNYLVFLLALLADIIYIMGWMKESKNCRMQINGGQMKKYIIPVILLVCVFIAFFTKGTLKNSTAYKCISYIQSGQAADFKEQMKLQKKILLDDTIKDVVLPEINDNQGPLMHMPLTKDDSAWTNTITKDFYRKNSVIAIHREDWNEQYGTTTK